LAQETWARNDNVHKTKYFTIHHIALAVVTPPRRKPAKVLKFWFRPLIFKAPARKAEVIYPSACQSPLGKLKVKE
jgi:hypothetical protein